MKSAYISELVGTVEALTKGMARIIDLGGNACSGALFLRRRSLLKTCPTFAEWCCSSDSLPGQRVEWEDGHDLSGGWRPSCWRSLCQGGEF